MRIGQECGQRWYRPRSWRGTIFRNITCKYVTGFAIGPIMIILKEQN